MCASDRVKGDEPTVRTNCPTETRALGEALASSLRPGDVLLLFGDMGAGKSELTRGIARGLGIDGPISSPSFTILQVYDDGRIPLYHFDWYRLQDVEELYEMGMDEYLGGDGIAVVEWPTQCPEAIPPCHLAITLTPAEEAVREITWQPVGGFHSIVWDEEGAQA